MIEQAAQLTLQMKF